MIFFWYVCMRKPNNKPFDLDHWSLKKQQVRRYNRFRSMQGDSTLNNNLDRSAPAIINRLAQPSSEKTAFLPEVSQLCFVYRS